MGYSSWLVDHWNNTIAKRAFLSEDVIFSTDFFRNELSWNRGFRNFDIGASTMGTTIWRFICYLWIYTVRKSNPRITITKE
jgi:hypothetical protein